MRWWEVEDRMILPDSVEHLAALAMREVISFETYERVIERLQQPPGS